MNYIPAYPFDETLYIKLAENLLHSDETELALKVLKSLPSYHRDHIPESIQKLTKEIESKLFLYSDYANNSSDNLASREAALRFTKHLTRAIVLKDQLKSYNDQGLKPHIVDFGPGDYSMPFGLYLEDFKFTYEPIGLYSKAREDFEQETSPELRHPKQKEAPTFFVGYEIIEHLYDVNELSWQAARLPEKPKHIFFSTPLYTYGAGNENWRVRGLPHLRAYTPREFLYSIEKLFKGYELKMYLSEDGTQTIHGVLI